MLGQDLDKLPVSVYERYCSVRSSQIVSLVTMVEGMTLLSANIDLANAESVLLMRTGREYGLKCALAKLSD